MTGLIKPKTGIITDRFISSICERLTNNKPVRRKLPQKGRIHIDRQLPFLCVYRIPPAWNDKGTRRLVLGEASYLIAPGEGSYHRSVAKLVWNVVNTLSSLFGAFLLVEIWSSSNNVTGKSQLERLKPASRIFTMERRMGSLSTTIESLEKGLKRIRILKESAAVEVIHGKKEHPPGLKPLIGRTKAIKTRSKLIGVEIRPVYRNRKSGKVYPLVLQNLHHGIARALKEAFFDFTRTHTTRRPKHYYVLGRRAVVKAVKEVDHKLTEVSNAFDFLLQVTPTNSEQAWLAFKRKKFEREPAFYYRPRPFDPALLKRKLYSIRTERVEDPTLAHLFKDKVAELDRQITMINDRGTRRFLYGSLQLYGGIEAEIIKFANIILNRIPPRSREKSSARILDAEEFAGYASTEIEYYRRIYPEFAARVQIRDDISPGLMVSRGHLLIGSKTSIPPSRVEALIQHEIGTHLLTYYNGRAQPFHQLYTGLPGYEELQEGLAVISEYLVGGLSRPRLRLLAGRVIAVRCLVEGATFVDTFKKLYIDYGFEQRTAFIITLRVYRGGGLTKDAIYLRGLKNLLDYLKLGGELEPLFVGKISASHLPIIEELQYRKVLRPAPLRPRYLADPKASERLERLRGGLSLLDLIERRKT
ncbi:MAG: flavohemoglobin expression-modulating QEGLA motif protein [Thermodesulfobacteriota bacterium]